MIHSYPDVYQIGHKAVMDIFNGTVIVEEKIDGSQFSFGKKDGELFCRSKNKELILGAPEKMFGKAVNTISLIMDKLNDGWVYRGEYLQSPHHNTLSYARVPNMHIIGFDINTGLEEYMSPDQKRAEFERIGLECVPLLFEGTVDNYDMFMSFLERESVLGGTKIEGVVVKNYALFTEQKKAMMGKYVSEAFKETHAESWKERNPTGKDMTQILIAAYKSEARWSKAIQHLKENGNYDGSPKDIGNLMKEVGQDVLKECKDEIKDKLFAYYWPNIQRGITSGLPEWYKDKLAKESFEPTP